MNYIVAVDEKWGIGKNNDLLFSLKGDMAFFRATTSGKTVIMGDRTLASLPGGVDRASAEAYGIEAVMLPGLPGKYAPISAGRILASYYLEELKNFRGGDVQ